MKNLHKLLFCCTLFGGMFCACEDRIEGITPDPPEETVPEDPGIKLKNGNVMIDASGMGIGVEVRVVGSDWKAYKGEEDCTWLKDIKPAEGGEGNNIIGLSAVMNEGLEERNTFIVIEHLATGDTVHVNVGQYTFESKYNHQTDSLALVAVYKALSGEEWMTPWNLKKPINTWEGITVEQVNGEERVTGIDVMQFAGLFGDLPNEVGDLRELKLLSFRGKVPSTLPVTLTSLRKLETIDIAFNGGEWFVPENAENLKSLRYLSLGQMTVNPASFDRLYRITALEELILNSYEGAVPKGIAALVNLKSLDMNMSKVTSLPDDFGNLPKLESLILSSCTKLTTLGASFGNLKTLKELNLSQCSKLAHLPDDIGNLNNLETLVLQNSGIEELPESFGNLTKLPSLNLNGCDKLKRLNSNIGEMTNLASVELTKCSSLLELPASFTRLALTRLQLSECSSLKSLPDDIGNMQGLTEVTLNYCSDLAALPESFGNLNALKKFSFNNSGSVTLPESFKRLTALEEFLCYKNDAETEGIKADLSLFANMKNLATINASYNSITGDLGILGKLPALTSVKLDYNKFDGQIDLKSIVTENLKELSLNGNKLTGTLEGIGRGTALTRFYMADNQLSGSIPAEFEDCESIQNFNVGNNNITGNIPAFVAKMKFSYGGLTLKGNRMSGVIPDEVLDCEGWKNKWYPDSNILPQQEGYGFSN